MRSISAKDRHLSLALRMRDMAREIMYARKEPWNARSILDGALNVLKFSEAPERIEVEIAIKADLAAAISMNPVYVNALLEQSAARLYEHTLRRALEFFGPDHAITAYVLAGKADMYRAQGHLWQAEQLYLKVLDIIDNETCPDPELLADVLTGAAVLLEKTNRKDKAQGLLRRAHEVTATLGK